MIAVIGDFMIDHYLWGESDRISPEAPVAVVNIAKEEYRLGGAGNVVNNLVALEVDVLPISVVGENSNRVFDLLKELKVPRNGIFVDKCRKTIIKNRVIANNHQMLRFDQEDIHSISKEYEYKIFSFLKKNLSKINLILLSDYGKGVLTKNLTQKIIELSNIYNKKLIVDPKKDFSKYKNAWMLKPNKKELSLATNININTQKDLIDAGWKFKKKLNLKYLVVTLSDKGMALFSDKFIQIPTIAKKIFDVTGAGDTVLATFGYCLNNNDDLVQTMHFANASAAIVVGKIGSATATVKEILKVKKEVDNSVDYKIVDFESIENIIEHLKEENKKIVFTNGCFDILHLGHVKYLQKAKALGDILIVGVNSNNSIKRLKGKNRPINDEYDRSYLLSSLKIVDYVVIFNQDTPYKLIQIIKPDILVKGKDYEGKDIVGNKIAKEVILIELIDGKSTTNIIKRING